MKVSDSAAGIFILALTFVFVVIYAAANVRDLKAVAIVSAFWVGTVILVALIDDEHLGWVVRRSKKEGSAIPTSGETKATV